MARPREVPARNPVGSRHHLFVITGTPEYRVKDRSYTFPAKCDCGTEFTAIWRGGFEARSCGCWATEKKRQANLKHGESTHPLYKVWQHAIARCTDPRIKAYPNYGGRGITFCDEWRNDFMVFKAWAHANGWKKGLDLDRTDNDGPYSPENCRFVTRKVNLRNKRNTVRVTAFGEVKTRAEWAEDPRCVVTRWTLESRLQAGWEPERAITAPKRARRKGTPERAVSTPVAVMRPKMGE